MIELYIDRSTSLSCGTGEVTITFNDYDDREIHLNYNSAELLRDIPALYEMAKRAQELESKWQKEKYREMLKSIDSDIKRPVGRPPKE